MLTTPPLANRYLEPSDEPVFIFAVDRHYRVRIAVDGDRPGDANAVKHETLFHNASVRAAGEIEITNGLVTNINDLTGSYRLRGYLESDPDFAGAVLRSFSDNSIPVDVRLRHYLERMSTS